LLDGLRAHAERCALIGDVRGKGLMIGIELVEPGTRTPAAAAAARVMELTKQRGLLVGKGGLHGNVLRLAPPMTLTDDEAAQALQILTETIALAEQELHR
ncbi:aminotransferase class III-fold pyridoxal phosphate-dependent enzyme, partial [Saccharopolyspora kobensis]